MRLINTTTATFEEFIGQNIPKYAILSHTWEEEEVSYGDYIEDRHCIFRKKGFVKIDMMCRLAKKDNIQYAWVDTCCIDKRSSAELTEAINSMFRWYERAEVCYAFLSDLEPGSLDDNLEAGLSQSRWFTRGWTLQELIAPHNVLFYNSAWGCIGCKDSLSSMLVRITRIPSEILRKQRLLETVPVVEKMEWASNRVTTRAEDAAYCLLGIFAVNMPLLYGEEDRAFQRLQEEIIKSTPDLSIFAWETQTLQQTLQQTRNSDKPMYCGILAKAPIDFSGRRESPRMYRASNVDFSLSNKGVRLHSTLVTYRTMEQRELVYVLPLDLWPTPWLAAVLLRKVGDGQFLRINPGRLHEVSPYAQISVLHDTHHLLLNPPIAYIPGSDQHLYQTTSSGNNNEYLAALRPGIVQFNLPYNMLIEDASPRSRFDDEDKLFFGTHGTTHQQDWGALKLTLPNTDGIAKGDGLTTLACMFYTAYWRRGPGIQCSLVPYRPYARQITDIQSEMVAQNLDTKNLLNALIKHRIPRTSVAVMNLPGTEFSTVVSYKHESRRDVYWKHTISFSCSICRTDRVPSTPQGENWML